MSITPHDFSEIRWRGHWIWVADETIEPAGFWSNLEHARTSETHAFFRKTFRLERLPGRVPARITADSRYALYENGVEAARGPIRSQPRRLYYDLVDLARFLRPGANVLTLYVKYYGKPNAFWMPAVPNIKMGTHGVLVFEANLGSEGWLVSDASWKARKADAWDDRWNEEKQEDGGIPIEVFDARRFPPDWHQPDFDDSAWDPAQLVPAMHSGWLRSHTATHRPLWPALSPSHRVS